mmetsp:Transcript_4430/g.10254  ORF Transcript_4430/g.10254 Transcript_4430/m.10254 type:complete len:89 (-) Transcript_4430:1092-1358(-)
MLKEGKLPRPGTNMLREHHGRASTARQIRGETGMLGWESRPYPFYPLRSEGCGSCGISTGVLQAIVRDFGAAGAVAGFSRRTNLWLSN